MELFEIEKWLERIYSKKLYLTSDGCDLVNLAQELITDECVIIREEKGITVPGINLFTVKGDTINAFSVKVESEYYVLVNYGVIEKPKQYLSSLNFENIYRKDEYINKLIKYGWLFIVFHEYGHIFCGHVDAGLTDLNDKCVQECEADMFSMDYLIKFVIRESKDAYMDELEDLYIAVYLLIENMQKDRWENYYDDKIIQNYYDPDCTSQRDHPLSAQRMIYLFSMFNIFIFDGKMMPVLVKEKILSKLRRIKNIEENDKNMNNDNNFRIVQDSIEELQRSLRDIRKKIPRLKLSGEKE